MAKQAGKAEAFYLPVKSATFLVRSFSLHADVCVCVCVVACVFGYLFVCRIACAHFVHHSVAAGIWTFKPRIGEIEPDFQHATVNQFSRLSRFRVRTKKICVVYKYIYVCVCVSEAVRKVVSQSAATSRLKRTFTAVKT